MSARFRAAAAATRLSTVGSDSAADAVAVISALFTYERGVVPFARGELERWQESAATIPDPLLRAAALAALHEKGQNAEATAVFAILAPRARPSRGAAGDGGPAGRDRLSGHARRGARWTTRWRTASPCTARSATPSPPAPRRGDWYRHHPQREDGGYLAALVAACQEQVAGLPGDEAVLPAPAGGQPRAAAKDRAIRTPRLGRAATSSRAGPPPGGRARLPLVGAGGGRQLLGGGPRADRRGR